jgi:hypothetical protein
MERVEERNPDHLPDFIHLPVNKTSVEMLTIKGISLSRKKWKKANEK